MADLPSGLPPGLGGAASVPTKTSTKVRFDAGPVHSGGLNAGIGSAIGAVGGTAAVFSRPPATAFARSLGGRTVRIIGDNNGWGLTRDREIVRRVFVDSGWSASLTDRTAINADRVAVNVHLEIPVRAAFDFAERNIIIPNPEWWTPAWNSYLQHPSVTVWAKTDDALRIFREFGARTALVGFQSEDKFDGSAVRERSFLHVAGNAPGKGTAGLVAAWRREWPKLHVTGSEKILGGIRFPAWVVRLGKLSDDDLRALQNRCLFHIYPGVYEGFGHAQWEGLSCGAIVLVPDKAPFDSWPNAFEKSSNVVARVLAMVALTDEEIADRRSASRAAWETAVSTFHEKAKAEIVVLDDQTPAKNDKNVVLDDQTPAKNDKNYSRRGRLENTPPMIYVGRVNCVTGYGVQARHQIHALRCHGLRLHVVDAGSTHSPDPQGRDPFVVSARGSDVAAKDARGTIFHVGPSVASEWQRKHLPRPHILVSAWETTKLPVKWVSAINAFDQVWCPTHWQRAIYLESGIHEKLLRVVPFALDPSLYNARGAQLPDIRREGYVFGSVLQWTERKNPTALIGAYLHAFEDTPGTTLVIKGYEGDSPSTSIAKHVEHIVSTFRVRNKPKIQAISRPLSNEEMLAFYRSIDCYVSSHRGEGFGLPIVEALLMEKPVIATDWSAPAEFAAGCFRGVPYVLEPPRDMNWQPFYSVDQLWAHVDSSALALAMREARAGAACPIERVKERFKQIFDDVGGAAAVALGGL